MKILIKNPNEKLDLKITLSEWRMPLTGLINRLDMAEERVGDFEDMPTETYQTENKEKEEWKEME